jgi:LuxR family maltose regulon positive regulatory protein
MPELFRSLDGLPPPREQDVPRPRLLSALQAARDAKVVVLAGGAGFGKTTLLSQWVHAPEGTGPFSAVAALGLSEEQADADGFMQALLRAVQGAQGHVSLAAARGALEQGQPLRAAGHLAEALNALPGCVLLILDGAQHLSTPAQQVLERFIHLLAEGHQLGLSVYDTAVLPFLASLLARGEAVVFGTPQLAFTEQETRRALPWLAPGAPLPVNWKVLEGWPIAVGLLQSGPTAAVSPDSLARWALDRLPEAVRVTVQDMSVWDEWGEAEARELGVLPVSAWLDAVWRAGLPIAPLPGGQVRPHGLLRRQLRTELQQRPERAASCWQRAAQVYERQGKSLLALRAAQAGGMLSEAVRLAGEVTGRQWPRREFWLARDVLEGFTLHDLPALLGQRLGVAWCETGRPEEGAALLRTLSDTVELEAFAWLALAEQAWRQGQMAEIRACLDAATRVVRTPLERVQIERFEVRVLVRLGQFAQALPRVEVLVGRAEGLGDAYELGACLSLHGIILFSLGRTEDGMVILQRELAFYDTQHAPFSAVPARMNLALCFAFQGQFNDALREARRAVQDAHAAFSRSLARTWITLVLIHLMRREFSVALEQVKEALSNLDLPALAPQERTDLWLQALNCAVRAGDPELRGQAERQLDACLVEFPEARAPQWAFVQRAVAFTRARLRVSEPAGLSHDAWLELVREFTGLLERPVPYGPPAMHELHVRLFLAEAQRRVGLALDDQIRAIEPLVHQAQTAGVLRTTAPDLPEVFAQLRRQPWWPARVLDDDKESGQEPARPVLTITALGHVQVKLNGHQVRFPFAKCEELLVWLALYGPGTRAQILDALWDGSNNPAHAEYFRLIVRRLRAVLTDAGAAHLNPVPYERGLYRLHEALDVQVDTLAVERPQTEPGEATVQVAVAAYTGPFLPRHTSEWVTLLRARLQDMAVMNLHRWAELQEGKAPEAALLLYRRMLHLDPLSDAGHEGVMRCCETLGDLAGAQQAQRARQRVLAENDESRGSGARLQGGRHRAS